MALLGNPTISGRGWASWDISIWFRHGIDNSELKNGTQWDLWATNANQIDNKRRTMDEGFYSAKVATPVHLNITNSSYILFLFSKKANELWLVTNGWKSRCKQEGNRSLGDALIKHGKLNQLLPFQNSRAESLIPAKVKILPATRHKSVEKIV